MSDDAEDQEMEEIRQKKLAELQQSMGEEQQRSQVKEQLEARKQAMLKQILSPEARSRLANIKMVKKELAENIENQLIVLNQSGRLPVPLTDEHLKEILKKFSSARRDIRIRRA